jgi:hypothetical protein
MSHKNKPPRQDRRRVGNAPVMAHMGRQSLNAAGAGNVTGAQGSGDKNAAINAKLRANMLPARGATPGQLVASGAITPK